MNDTKLTKLCNLLQSHLQDEQAVQNRLLTLLKSQEAAALAGDTQRVETTTAEIEQELAGEGLRQQRRTALMSAFEGELGVPDKLLTVGSLIERLDARGLRTSALRSIRTDLKGALLSVRKLSRRLKVIARGHGEVLNDVLRILAGSDEGAMRTGFLVDAEV